MPNTPKYALPYPGAADPPNGSAQMQALAVATESALDGVVATQDTRDDEQDAKIADLYTKVPSSRVSWGAKSVTFDANGKGTLVHGTGWVPSVVLLTPATSSTPVGLTFDTTPGPTLTQLTISAHRLDNGNPFVGSLTVHYIVRD